MRDKVTFIEFVLDSYLAAETCDLMFLATWYLVA